MPLDYLIALYTLYIIDLGRCYHLSSGEYTNNSLEGLITTIKSSVYFNQVYTSLQAVKLELGVCVASVQETTLALKSPVCSGWLIQHCKSVSVCP